MMKISEIKHIIKEIVDEAWLSDRLPSTNFSFQMGDREKSTQSYWIKPDGTEFRTTFRGHSDKANQILQAYPDKEKELREKDAQVILWEMGWVSLQITVPDAKAIVKHYITIPITSEQIRSLRNIATRFNDDQTHIKKIDVFYDATEHRDIILESVIDERLNFSDLYDDTDDERIAKSELPGMRVKPLQVTTNNDKDMWRFDYSYISSERSEYKQYGGKIGHKGHIYFFKEDIDPDDNLEDLDCMVDCDCRDFKYRWAYALAQDDASIVGNKSLNKSTGAPPVKTNPMGHQQLCKHLSALRKYVVTNIEKAMTKAPYRKRPMNIFESMDQLANKGKFVTGYYDKK